MITADKRKVVNGAPLCKECVDAIGTAGSSYHGYKDWFRYCEELKLYHGCCCCGKVGKPMVFVEYVELRT